MTTLGKTLDTNKKIIHFMFQIFSPNLVTVSRHPKFSWRGSRRLAKMNIPGNGLRNNIAAVNINSGMMESTFSTTSAGFSQQFRMVPRTAQTIPLEYPVMTSRQSNQPSTIFRQAFQTGFLSILYAIGNNPLDIWEKQIRNGHVKRLTDIDIRTLAIEILSQNVATTFITTPINPAQTLGIRLPIIVLVVKNLKRYFLYEIQILDDTKTRRRVTVSNYHQAAKVRPFGVQLPLHLDEGWNQVSMNLAELTTKMFGTQYKETTRVQIHANCRLRRIYFCDRVYSEEEVPTEFKTFITNASANEIAQGNIELFKSSTPNTGVAPVITTLVTDNANPGTSKFLMSLPPSSSSVKQPKQQQRKGK